VRFGGPGWVESRSMIASGESMVLWSQVPQGERASALVTWEDSTGRHMTDWHID
jgi:hypothetical protein